MASKAGIQINIVGNVDAAAFKKAEQAIASLGKTAQQAGQQGAKGLADLKKPIDSLKVSASQLMSTLGGGTSGFAVGAFNVLKEGAASLKQEFGGVTSLWQVGSKELLTLGSVGAGVAVGLVAVAKKAADAYAAWGSEVKSLQNRTGASAEEASRLAFVLGHLGVDADEAARAFQILGRNIITGAAPLKEFFSSTQLAQLGSKDLISQLPVLQAKYQSLSSAQEKSAFVMAAFGRGGAALRPLLSLSADETARLARESDRLGLTLDQNGISKATEYKRSLNDAKLALRGLAVQAGGDTVSGITTLANAFTAAIAKFNAMKSNNIWQTIFGGAEKGPDILGRAIESLAGRQLFLRSNTQSATGAMQEQEQEATELAPTLDNLQSATLGLFNANRSFDRAVQAVADAQYNLGQAQRSLSKLQAEGAVDAQKVADAHKEVERALRGVDQANRGVYDSDRSLIESHRGVERAERSLISAQEQQADSVRGLADAQRSLMEAQQKLVDVQKGADVLDRASAELRAQQAVTAVQRAQQRLTQAEVNADRVGRDYNATAEDKADANLSVVEASQALTAAQIDQKRAQQDLTEIIHQGEEGSKEYTDALKDVQDASRAVEQASRQQRDATQAVTDAQLALVDSAGAVEQAEYGHQQALLAVRDASDAVNEARRKLREAEAGDPDFANKLASARHGVAAAERALTDARLEAGAASFARAEAEQKEADALSAAGANTKVLLDRLSALRSQFPQYAAFYDQLIKLLGSTISAYYAGYPGNPYAGPPVPGRQHGGPVTAGRAYLVGERGPEPFVPNVNGTIYPKGTWPSSTTTVNVYVSGSVIAERDLADTVRRALIDQTRRGG